MKTTNLLKNPSIHNIIIQDQNAKLNTQIKQYFKIKSFPTFPLNDLINLPNYIDDQRFYLLVKQLQGWNKRVQGNQMVRDVRTELYRNKFVYTSLRNIIVSGSKGSTNYQVNLDKLFDWFRKNSQQQMPLFFTARKKTKQDEDWQVRKTFKSNMPLELRNYQRRALFTTQQDIKYLQQLKVNSPTDEKLIEYSAIKQYKSKQLKQRQARQQKQICASKTLLKSKKSRFEEDHCRNFQYYHGKFNSAYKTAVLFARSTDKSYKSPINRTTNFGSFSILQKQKDGLEQIKKYRFNSALGRKTFSKGFFQQKDQNIQNMNKTTKSFMTTKPYETTMSDVDEPTATNLRKQTLFRQPTIKLQLNKTKNKLPSNLQDNQQDEKQNISQQEFTEFNQLKNWQGQRLMSNPFEKKNKLKKKKKK